MSEKDFRDLKDLNTKCPQCAHPKRDHMRPPRVDPQRMKGSMVPVFSVCIECRKTEGL